MCKEICKTDVIKRLEAEVEHGHKIFLIDCSDTKLINVICERILKAGTNDIELWHSSDIHDEVKIMNKITESEMGVLREIYSLYDFSDKVSYISETSLYGSLFNYLNTGILTKCEMVDALLCRI